MGQEIFAELSRLETRGPHGGKTIATAGPHQLVPLSSTLASSGWRIGAPPVRRSSNAGLMVTLPGVGEEAEEGEGGAEEKKATPEDRVVQTCARVCGMLEACPEARHYVMAAERCLPERIQIPYGVLFPVGRIEK